MINMWMLLSGFCEADRGEFFLNPKQAGFLDSKASL